MRSPRTGLRSAVLRASAKGKPVSNGAARGRAQYKLWVGGWGKLAWQRGWAGQPPMMQLGMAQHTYSQSVLHGEGSPLRKCNDPLRAGGSRACKDIQ